MPLTEKRELRRRVIQLGGESLWIVGGQAAAVLGALLGVRWLTLLLEPAEYGELALGTTVATLVHQIALGPLTVAVLRFHSSATEVQQVGTFLGVVQRAVCVRTAAIVTIGTCICLSFAISGKAHLANLLAVSLAYALVAGYSSILGGIQNAARQRSLVALHEGFAPWSRLLIASGLVLAIGRSSEVAMAGFVIGMTVVLLSQWKFTARSVEETLLPSSSDQRSALAFWEKKIHDYIWPFGAWGLFTWSQLVSDRWALQLFRSTDEVGYYSVLYQLGYYPTSIAAGFVLQLLSPVFFQMAGDGQSLRRLQEVRNRVFVLAGSLLVLTAVVFSLAIVTHRALMTAIVAPDYAGYSPFLPWMLLSGGIFAAGQAIGLDLQCRLKSHEMFPLKMGTAIAGTALNFAGAYFYGVPGVVAAGVAFSTAYLVWMAILALR